MHLSAPSRFFPVVGRVALAALGCAFSLAIFVVPTSKAGEGGAALQRLDDSLPAIPLAASFEKADGDNGPYELILKNTSADPIKAAGSVRAGTSGDRVTRDIAEHLISRAETWTITGLSEGDRVTISADGFAPLSVKVP